MTLMQVPIVDIAPYRGGDRAAARRVADQVGEACRDIGFLVIAGHGIEPDLVERVDDTARGFFDLPLAEKMRVVRPGPDVTRGYVPLEGEAVAASRGEVTPGDLNESMMIGQVDVPESDSYVRAPEAGTHFHPNLWPERPRDLRPAWTAYYRAMGDLAATVMRIFATALDVRPDFFDDKIDRHISRLRARNYPEQPEPPRPGQLRAGAHADYGSLTILKAEANPGGLEVCNQAGEWVTVPIVPGTFVVNIGELMARWTNDRWPATLHRVVNPPRAEALGSRRQSIVFFHNPNYDAVIRCIPSCADSAHPAKYPVTTSGEHLRRQFVRTQTAAY
jgi:isopenicillin N synthase-like dioxygenase